MFLSWLPVAVSALVLSCHAFRLPPSHHKRAQNLNNFVLTNAYQNLFYTPISFGTFDIFAILSTSSGDTLLPSTHAGELDGFKTQAELTGLGNITSGSVNVANRLVSDQDILIVLTDQVAGYYSRDYAYLGLGTINQSMIYSQVNGISGEPFIVRTLADSPHSAYYTLLLQPDISDYGHNQSFGGILTIGEIVDFEHLFNITSSDLDGVPDLQQVTTFPQLQYNGEGATIVIDAINGPYGPINVTSNLQVDAGKAVAIIDTIFPVILVNADVTKAIYSSVPGAQYSDNGVWTFPCTELTVTITIGGHDYLLSPTSVVAKNDTGCYGLFQTIPDSYPVDIVLGTPFLKNVYALFGYTTSTAAGPASIVSDPYVQIMPITNYDDAHSDWLTLGWDGNNSSASNPQGSSGSTVVSSSQYVSTGSLSASSSGYSAWSQTSSGYSSTSSSTSVTYSTPSASSPSPTFTGTRVSGLLEDAKSNTTTSTDGNIFLGNSIKDWLYHCLPAIVVGAIFVVLVLIGVVIWALVRRHRGPDGKGPYKNLHEGGATVPLHGAEEGQTRYADPYKD